MEVNPLLRIHGAIILVCYSNHIFHRRHKQLGENSHFVGLTNNINPPSPVPPLHHKRSQKDTIEIDDVEASRSSVKRRYWTHDEEVRLASAWLNTSKDPIHGNDKKSDSFWGQITAEFNKSIEA